MIEEKIKSIDEMFCHSCGAVIKKEAEICPKCGVRIKNQKTNIGEEAEGKDWLTTLLLCFFLGLVGVHRFYTGHKTMGIVIIVTLGGIFVIIPLIDFIKILLGSYKDSEGNPLVRNK